MIRPPHFAPLAIATHALLVVAAACYAQQSDYSEVIIRLAPGYTAKEFRTSLPATHPPPVSIRPAIRTSSESERSTLSLYRLDRYYVVTINDADTGTLLSGLRRMPGVEVACVNLRYRLDQILNDSLYGAQYALERMEVPNAWLKTRGSRSIVVGFVDTGIDYDHPDLAGAFAINEVEDRNGNGQFDPWSITEYRNGVAGDLDDIDNDGNGYADDVIGYDFVDEVVPNTGDWTTRDADPYDDNGHGTSVAGVVAARADNRIGIAGAAPGIRILALRAFDATGNGDDDDVAAATVYAADRGVRVLNMSFGDYYDSPLLRDAIRYARAKGVLVVASAGNEAISNLHFPSAYPEAVSVASTTREDNLSPFSSFGSQTSISAPGSDILTLARGGRYGRLSGTSLSAPYVSATAALVCSIHPEWSPDEIRAALEFSADDLGRQGWDVYFGAGRVNARRAVDYPGPASVYIHAPDFGAGYPARGVVAVIGSAVTPLMSHWRLDIGLGDAPSEWSEVTSDQLEGRLHDTLGVVDLSTLRQAVWTVRLRVTETNGHVTESRTRILVGNPPPVILSVDTADMWRFDRRAYFVSVETDQPTDFELHFRPQGANDWSALTLEPERSGRRRIHRLVVTADEVAPNIPYQYYLIVRNAAGDTAMIGNPQNPCTHIRSGEGFPANGFARQDYDLPYGYVLGSAQPAFDGGATIAVNEFTSSGDFGTLALYQAKGGKLVRRDTIAYAWAPRGFGDIDGDGLIELLAQAFGSGIVFGQAVPGGSPLARVRYVDSSSGNFYAAQLSDLDNDGRDEVIARTSNLGDPQFYIAQIVNGVREPVATLVNTTSPARGDAQNFLGSPVVAVADFTGDGQKDILFGDEDSDFILYRNEGRLKFEESWFVENEGNGGTEYVAAADLDGDEQPEAVVAFHSRLAVFPGEEYPPPYWTVQIYSFNQSGEGTLRWQDRFAYVRPPNTLRSGISSGELNGQKGEEVILTLYPNTYVLTWRGDDNGRVHPLWWKGGSVGNRPLVVDVDGNGKNELGVGDGSRIGFFELDSVARALDPPASITAYALDDARVRIEWESATGASHYNIYRALSRTANGPLRFDSIVATSSTFLIDSGIGLPAGRLDSATYCFYSITAVKDSGGVLESGVDNPAVAFTHAPARIASATSPSRRSIRIDLDGTLSDRFLRAGSVEVRTMDGIPLSVSTAVWSGDHAVTVMFTAPVTDTVQVRLSSLFRDLWNTPADTSLWTVVRMADEERPGERFIASAASPVGSLAIVVHFNAPVDVATVDLSDFVFNPQRKIIRAIADSAKPESVFIELDEATPVGPLGQVYTVTIDSLSAVDGRLINDGAGSVVGFTISSSNLSSVLVFPHPFSLSRDGTMTFGGLTQAATVRVMAQDGREVARLETREGTGGLVWNGLDAYGSRVTPGIYLYVVSTKGEDGSEIDSEVGKIAVIP